MSREQHGITKRFGPLMLSVKRFRSQQNNKIHLYVVLVICRNVKLIRQVLVRHLEMVLGLQICLLYHLTY